jgi:hypothetical protein
MVYRGIFICVKQGTHWAVDLAVGDYLSKKVAVVAWGTDSGASEPVYRFLWSADITAMLRPHARTTAFIRDKLR